MAAVAIGGVIPMVFYGIKKKNPGKTNVLKSVLV